jgi:hypothetical protein
VARALQVADVMSSTPVTPPGGINTGVNPLAADARGAMRTADNCVIPSRDKMESRRGGNLSAYATSSAPTTTGEFYSDTLFVQHGTKLSRDGGSSFTEVGSYSPPTGASMKFLGGQGKEINGDFYFTTSAGVYSMDSTTATPKLSGIPRPGDFFYADADSGFYSRLSGNVNAGWMPKDAAVAYRALLGRKDASSNIKLSAPSGRLVLVNPGDLTIAIGSWSRAANVVTMTVAANSHTFRVGDKFTLTVTGGDVANIVNIANQVVTSVTSTTIVYSDTAANYVNVASVAVTSGSKNLQLAVDLPSEAVAGDFVQLYRTLDVSGTATDPGDECFLSYERPLTATDISNTYVTITDTTPSSFLGDPLYSNAASGDGEQASNHRPPFAKDICLFDGRAFFLNTASLHRLNLRLLGTGSGVSGLQSGDVIAINTRAMVAGTNFTVATEFSASLNIQRTIASLVFNTTRFGLGWKTYATHDGDNGTGGVLVEGTNAAGTFTEGTATPTAIYAGTSRASAWGDPLAATKTVTTGASTARTGGNLVTMTTGSSHGFSTGDVIMLCYRVDTVPDANFAVGLKTITVTGATTFTYAESGANVNLSGGSVYFVYATTFKSTADTLPLMFSKRGQPDAVPLLNFIQDIPRGQTVLRAAPLREVLYVFLANGDIWTVAGAYPYRVSKFDGTATLIAEGSLVEHNNRLHCLTTQGVVAISSGGVEILDESIKPDLLPLIAAETTAGTLGSIRACSYESEHQYRLYLSTTSSFYVYVYNSLYRKWTRQTDGRAWGVVRRSTNKLHQGHTSLGRYWLERKAYDRTDFADFMGSFDAGTQSSDDTVVGAFTAFSGQVAAGDILLAAAASSSLAAGAWTVTAVAGSVGNQTISGTANANLGSATSNLGTYVAGIGSLTVYVYRPIANTLAWLHDSEGSPQMEKTWRDLVLHFSRHSVANSTATFSAIDGSSAGTGTITPVAPTAYSYATAPTLPISRRVNVDDSSAYLMATPQLAPGMTVAECFAAWTLLGYTFEVEQGSERLVT